MGPSGRFTHVNVILMFGTSYMQVLNLGRAPRRKETLPGFHEKCRVTRHSRVFLELTGSQRTPRCWGVTYLSMQHLDIRIKVHTNSNSSIYGHHKSLPPG